ncbi:MAG TPA: cyclic nucleotide-binding domain-containing protein, partial [Kofleriaceae bacterium]|nr:cyclic nucleotide-binding domain-containing protein [Kofleriaceae bacterium]
LELAPEDAACHALLAALLASAPAPRASPPPGARASPPPGARPSPMPSRTSPLPSRPSPSPLPRPSEPSPLRPSEPLLWPSQPPLRPSEPPARRSEPEPLPRPSEPLLRPSEPLLRPSEPPLRPSELTAADPLPPLPDPIAAGPLLRPSEPLPRPSELTAAGPLRRSSGEMTPLPAPLAYHDADPTTGTLQRLSPSDLPPSLREELAAYPEIAGIAAAARQISASLIAASRMIEQTEELDDDDLSAEVDTGRLLRSGALKLPPSASVPPPMRRPPTPPPMPPPVRRPPTPSPAPRAPALGPAAPATSGSRASVPTEPPPVASRAAALAAADTGLPASTVDDDEPTLPPSSAAAQPGPIEDEKTEPRELPTRVRPPSIAPPTVATGPLASAFFAPLPPRNRAAVLQRFRRRMVAPGTAVIRRGETGHGLVIVVRGRLELHAEGAAGAPVALAAFEPGDYLGETSLLARAPAAAQVVAATDSELLVLSADDFYDVTSAFPALRAELEATAARRSRDLEPRLSR